MRKALVLVNYMRTNPTIVDDIVRYFSDDFEQIYVINRNTKDTYRNIRSLPNVTILEISRLARPFFYIGGIFSFFRKECREDISFAKKEKRFGLRFLKEYYKYLTIGNMLYHRIRKIKKVKQAPEEVSMLSVWFTYEAYAIARLKKKYPALNCVSMAHAHEIETFDNKYTFFLKKYQHAYLDRVVFISNTKMHTYFNHVCTPLKIDTDRCVVKYWGSKRHQFDETPSPDSSRKLIVTCSTVEPLKRVEEIATAISLLDFDYEWFHFGDGSSMDSLRSTVASFDEKVQSRMHLMGRISNDEIKRFYTVNCPDLFINFSTTEGLPISVMEALSYSIPAIVTDVGGEREIVSDGINGYILSKDTSTQKLAECISKVLNSSAEQLNRMKLASRSKWEATFNLDNNIIEYLNFLR